MQHLRGAALRVHSVERSIVLGAMSSSCREMLFEHEGLAARAIGRAFLSAAGECLLLATAVPSNRGGAFPEAAGRPLADDKSAWRTPCSAF